APAGRHTPGQKPQHVRDTERARVGQPGLDAVLQSVQTLQQPGRGLADAGLTGAFDRCANLDLAALEPCREQLAQGRFVRAHLLWELEDEIEEAAVDRTDLDAETARGLLPPFALGVGAGGLVLACGVPGHSVNCHRPSLLCCWICLYARDDGTAFACRPIAFGRNSRIMSQVKPSPLLPDTVIGGYRVIRRLSAGGFGVVYLAVDPGGQQVAIKEYLPSSLATRGT